VTGVSGLPVAGHSSLHRHKERTGKEGQVLHRSKRGWVWNQFFVIEEYTGPDPVLVGRVSSHVCVCVCVCVSVNTCSTIARQQPARWEQLGLKCLAQGHLDT